MEEQHRGTTSETSTSSKTLSSEDNNKDLFGEDCTTNLISENHCENTFE